MRITDRIILISLTVGVFTLAGVEITGSKSASAYHGLTRYDVESAVRSALREMQAGQRQQPDTGQVVRATLQNCTLTGHFVENKETGDETDFIARLSC